MKRAIIFVLCMIISIITFGQEKKPLPDQIKGEKVLPPIKGAKMSPPLFIGNDKTLAMQNESQFGLLNDYLARNIHYPEESVYWNEEGTEVIRFIVTPEGEVTGFNIINSVSPEIDKEAIRVLKTTNGMWKPGLNNGEPASMATEVSVAFEYCYGTEVINTATNFVRLAKMYLSKGNKQFFIKDNCKSALIHYNRAVNYLPNDLCLLASRGLCKYELGDKEGACKDWTRIKTLGGAESDFYLDKFCDQKGYSEMICILQKKE